MSSSHRLRAAFTLIEVLVVMAVVAVVIALAVGAISKARTTAQAGASLANLRTLGQTFEMYTHESGAYPWGLGGWGWPPGRGGLPWAISFSVWHTESYWPVFFHDHAPWPENYRAWLSPGADPQRFEKVIAGGVVGFSVSQLSSYSYSNSFVADPSLWRTPYRDGPVRIRATRPDQVAFPGSKVLLYDAERSYLRDPGPNAPRPLLLADLSAHLRQDGDATGPVQNPLHQRSPRRYHDTPEGILGRDF